MSASLALRNTGSDTARWVSVMGPGDTSPSTPTIADIASGGDLASSATIDGEAKEAIRASGRTRTVRQGTGYRLVTYPHRHDAYTYTNLTSDTR